MSRENSSDAASMTIEEIQDHTLTTDIKAQQAIDHLEDMITARRTQTEGIVSVVRQLMDRLKASELRRLEVEDENYKLSNHCADIEQHLRILKTNYARLSDGYAKMVRFVEETRQSSVSMNERIDNMLLHYDLGLGREGQPILPPRHAEEFTERTFNSSNRHPSLSELNSSLDQFGYSNGHEKPNSSSEFRRERY